ncbi:MAG: hypothetical protein Q4A55_06155 [Aerococcus sp.]|nr:hypothetical protein [Aerococcus sp.]
MHNNDQLRTIIYQSPAQSQYLTFPKVFVEILGDLNTALFLNQVIYWSDRHHHEDGYFYKTKKDWEEETTLSRCQIDRCIKKLEHLNFIETKTKLTYGKTVMHFKANVEVIFSHVFNHLQVHNTTMSKDNAMNTAPSTQNEQNLTNTKEIKPVMTITVNQVAPKEPVAVVKQEVSGDELSNNHSSSTNHVSQQPANTDTNKRKIDTSACRKPAIQECRKPTFQECRKSTFLHTDEYADKYMTDDYSHFTTQQKSATSESPAHQLAVAFLECLKENNPTISIQPNESTVRTFETLLKTGYDYQEIKQTILFSQQDEYWQTIVVSAFKFLKNYATLRMKSKYAKAHSNGNYQAKRGYQEPVPDWLKAQHKQQQDPEIIELTQELEKLQLVNVKNCFSSDEEREQCHAREKDLRAKIEQRKKELESNQQKDAQSTQEPPVDLKDLNERIQRLMANRKVKKVH